MSIEIKNLTKSFGDSVIFDDFSLSIPDIGIFGIFGPSGCGKTTLIRMLCGLESPDSGSIEGLDGRKIAVMFQEDRLIETATVLKNVSLVSDKETALKYLEAAGLGSDTAKYPSEISGGMARRTALARALAYGGDVLILDEPFKGIEVPLKIKIEALIKDFAKEKTVILVTHDEEEKLIADASTDLSTAGKIK